MAKPQEKAKNSQLNLGEVKNYLVRQGYIVEQISQPWRYVSAVVKQQGAKYMFKLATNLNLNLMLENEAAWYKRFQDYPFSTVKVPRLHVQGNYKYGDKILSYLIVQYIEGEELAEEGTSLNNSQLADLDSQLDNIAIFTTELPNTPGVDLFPRDMHEIPKYVGRSLYLSARNWLQQAEYQIEGLDEFLQERKDSLSIGYAHGDLAPWHFMKDSREDLYVVDPEHGSTVQLQMYDAAHFYHRTYSISPRLAQRFLSILIERSEMDGRLKNQFELILAVRIAGGIWEAKVKDWGGLEYNEDLLQRLLAGNIF